MVTIALISDGPNTGKLKIKSGSKTSKEGDKIVVRAIKQELVEIKYGRFIVDDVSHPLMSETEKYFQRVYCLEYEKRRIYYFYTFGNKEGVGGFHVGFTWWQHQQFLLLQKRHWIQKEENIRYIVNVVFLVLGLIIGIKSI